MPALFAAERISVLVSRPVYHWVLRADRANASRRRPAPDAHAEAIRELLAIVDARTEPGPVRDRYYLHWYRVKVLRRLGAPTRDREYGARLLAAARALIGERFPPRLDDRLSFNLRLRARLARRGDAAGLERAGGLQRAARARAGRRGRAATPARSSSRGDGTAAVRGASPRSSSRGAASGCCGSRRRSSPRTSANDDRDITDALGGAARHPAALPGRTTRCGR